MSKTTNLNPIPGQDPQHEPPPILKTWRNLYWLVIGNMIGLIILFYLLTIAYS